jgi:hypothetical protein
VNSADGTLHVFDLHRNVLQLVERHGAPGVIVPPFAGVAVVAASAVTTCGAVPIRSCES